MQFVSPEQMRQMDHSAIHDYNIPGTILMEHAAQAAVQVLHDVFTITPHTIIGILCGGGNNGGDGFAMARLLHLRGYPVFVGLLQGVEGLSGDALTNFRCLTPLGVMCLHIKTAEDLAEMPDCDVWCDALLGTGLNRNVEGIFALAIDYLNQQNHVLAVDIPSGLDAQTGQILGHAVQAQATVSFALPKTGQLIAPGRFCGGALHVVDIGMPPQVITQVGTSGQWLTPQWAQDVLEPRPGDYHKGRAGRVLVLAGSHTMSGAAMLTARAALEAGAGLITVGTTPEVVERIALSCPEVMAFDASVFEDLERHCKQANCIAIGPGLGMGEQAKQWLLYVLTDTKADLVIDADALNLICEANLFTQLIDAATKRTVVLTPHPGEMGRLMDLPTSEVLTAPLDLACALAHESGCLVVLKLATTIVASDLDELAINQTGNPGMSSAGMGDTLTGMIAALLPQHPDAFDAVSLAVCWHGMAGDLAAQTYGQLGTTASRVLDALPILFAKMS